MKKSLIFITIIISMCLILPNSDVYAFTPGTNNSTYNPDNTTTSNNNSYGTTPGTNGSTAPSTTAPDYGSTSGSTPGTGYNPGLDLEDYIPPTEEEIITTVINNSINMTSSRDECNNVCDNNFSGEPRNSECKNLCKTKYDEADKAAEDEKYAEYDDAINSLIQSEYTSIYSVEECKNLCTSAYSNDSDIFNRCLYICDENKEELEEKADNRLNHEGSVSEWDKLFATATNPAECGGIMTSRFLELLVQVYNTIILVAGILAIILGASDFLKATGSDEKDSLNKSFKKLMTRLVILIILFILPQIIIFILDTFGDEAMKTCLEHF